MEQKRLFVGNLPLTVNEDEVKKKFSKYGNIVSTEIKHRFSSENEVISTFGFVTLEANRSNFEACKYGWISSHLVIVNFNVGFV